MKSSVKLKDIATNLNLSIGTVQRALHGKGGYSEETRKRILAEASRLNYTANPLASAMRRSEIRIAVVLPEPVNDNKYFFQYIWKGITKAQKELEAYNVIIEPIYADTTEDESCKVLRTLLERETPIHGLITNASGKDLFKSVMKKFAERSIPAFMLNAVSRTHESGICTANANGCVGKLGADIFLAIHPRAEGKLLILGGSRESERQSERINDFSRRLTESCPQLFLQEIHVYTNMANLKTLLEEYLCKFNDLIGIYAVSARETLSMCEIVNKLGLSGKITTIGTDVFPELLPYFENGTLTASVYQYPTQQGYLGVKTVFSTITKTENIKTTEIVLPTAAVFKSNAELFCNETALMNIT